MVASICRSTQFVPHFVPLAQPQLPAMQVSWPEQTVPQLPQLLPSDPGSTQIPLHGIWGAVQPPLAHCPFWQIWSPAHALRHLPQWLVSVWRSTQVFRPFTLQAVCPSGHRLGRALPFDGRPADACLG